MADDTFKNEGIQLSESARKAFDAAKGFSPVQQQLKMQKVMLNAAPEINGLFSQTARGEITDPQDVNDHMDRILLEAGGADLTPENNALARQKLNDIVMKRINSYGERQLNTQEDELKAKIDIATNAIGNNLLDGHLSVGEALDMVGEQKQALDKTQMSDADKNAVLTNMKAKIYSTGVTKLVDSDVEGARVLLSDPDVKQTLNNSAYLTLQKLVAEKGRTPNHIFVGEKLSGLQKHIMTGDFNRDDVLNQATTITERQFLEDRLNMYSQIKSLSTRDLIDLRTNADREDNVERSKMITDRLNELTRLSHADPISLGVKGGVQGFTPLNFSSPTLALDVEHRANNSDQLNKYFMPSSDRPDTPVALTPRVFTNQELNDMNNIIAHGSPIQKKNIINAVSTLYSMRGDTGELPPNILAAGISQHYGGTYQLNQSDSKKPIDSKELNTVYKFLRNSGITNDDKDLKSLASTIMTSAPDNAEQSLAKFFGQSYRQLKWTVGYSTIPLNVSTLPSNGADLYLDDGSTFNPKNKSSVNLNKVYAGKGQYFLKTPLSFGFFGTEQFVRDRAGNRITIGANADGS